jgi:hypothetical protein
MHLNAQLTGCALAGILTHTTTMQGSDARQGDNDMDEKQALEALMVKARKDLLDAVEWNALPSTISDLASRLEQYAVAFGRVSA